MAPFSPEEQPTSNARPTIAPRPRPAEAPQLVAAAMERFSCSADKCEDTCCRDFTVTVDRPSLDRMKETLSRTPDGRERLLRLVVIGRPSRHADGPAHLQMGPDGACPMLTEERKCSVHSAFGEASLTTTCSIFPRTSLAVGGHLEVGGSLACPEVARLVLLSEDGLTLRPAQRPMLPRAWVGKAVPEGEGDAYADHFVAVRDVLLRLLADAAYPVASRLAFAAHLADRTAPFFHRGTRDFAGAGRRFAERRLGGELDGAADPALLSSLHADLHRLDVSGEAVLGLATTLLLGRLRLPHAARYRGLLRDALGSLFSHALGRPAALDENVSPTLVWNAYRARRDALDARAGARVGFVFGNWARHFVMRNPFTDASSLLEYAYRLGVHLAALRLLFVGHPAIGERLAGTPDAKADAAAVDRAAVETIQIYTKAIGHSIEYTEAALKAAETSGGFGFGRLVLMAKFV